ncbi:MAG: Txe/YoeB family addiction module toxin [Bryobacterales bacterium]|nr:Txe/YoeB family addiction module toxin [Bryobacterales bacterium]
MPNGCSKDCAAPARTRANRRPWSKCARRPALPEAVFHPEFRDDLHAWAKTDPAIAHRILALVEETLAGPAAGAGRPVALKGVLDGCMARRVTLLHRLVYRVAGDRIHFLQAKYHW